MPKDVVTQIKDMIAEEGRETCSLEDDEIERLYSKTYSYMNRIFRNPRLHPAIEEFVRTIARRRELSGMEIRDELASLNII